jgi:hypothetical protein
VSFDPCEFTLHTAAIYFCHKSNILVGVWNFYISCSDQYREQIYYCSHYFLH